MRIMVLLGGSSPERMVSLASGEAVAKELDKMGHQVLKCDPVFPDKVYTMLEKVSNGQISETPVGEEAPLSTENITILISNIKKYAVDLVFPMLHGGWGEDGRLQALFEITGIPFVGSDSMSSALAMNKHLAKRVVASEGIPTPDSIFLHQNSLDRLQEACNEFGYPLVIKPNAKGSTVGVSIVKSSRQLPRAIELALNQNDHILIERYISGRELTVGILDGQGMAVVEVMPKDGFYDYKHKYTDGQTEYIYPAKIGKKLTRECIEYAVIAFRLIGCEVYGRVDFRLSEEGKLYFLEVNTIPGMTNHSLVPMAAQVVGLDFANLVNRIAVISMNLKRHWTH